MLGNRPLGQDVQNSQMEEWPIEKGITGVRIEMSTRLTELDMYSSSRQRESQNPNGHPPDLIVRR